MIGRPQIPTIDVREAEAASRSAPDATGGAADAAGAAGEAAAGAGGTGEAAAGAAAASETATAAGAGTAAGAPVPGAPARPLLVDVRELDEFVRFRAEGAVLYPTSSFLLRFEELPRDRPLHIVCNSGNRSAAVTAFLIRSGWTDVHDVAGGMVAWLREGLPVRRGPLEPGEGELA